MLGYVFKKVIAKKKVSIIYKKKTLFSNFFLETQIIINTERAW